MSSITGVDLEKSVFSSSSLPREVLIKILSFMNSATLLTFCKAYDCHYFLKEREVNRRIDLSKNYKVRNFVRLSEIYNFNYVTVLNVNCLYWIPAEDFRDSISKLVNLETLYAMQTQFSLTENDTEILARTKIHKLGVTVGCQIVRAYKIPSVETLYVGASDVKILTYLIKNIFPNLKNLWFEVDKYCGGEDKILDCLNAEKINKVFCQTVGPLFSTDFEHDWLIPYYTNLRPNQRCVMCYEKLCTEESKSKETGFLDIWGNSDVSYCPIPYYSPKDAKKLFFNKTPENMFFEELNFYHTKSHCSQQCREPFKKILRSPNASKLRRLCIMMCLLENKNIKGYASQSSAEKRMAVEASSAHSIAEMFANVLNLEHLEIYVCYSVYYPFAVKAFTLISMFTNLHTLVLEVPVNVGGEFLGEVFEKCPLKVLKIFSYSHNDGLNTSVCHNISKATLLVDFRYENNYIPLEKLLKSLCLIKTRNLQRVTIFCFNHIDRYILPRLKEFLKFNSQLVFLYILIKLCEDFELLRLAQETLNLYKKERLYKVFVISRNDSIIPKVHQAEMVSIENNVASLSPLDDFVTF